MQKIKEKIIGFFRDNAKRPLTFKELTQACGVTREARAAFKEALDELVDAGEMIKTRGNGYILPARIHIITGRLSCHREGYGFVTPDEGGEDIFIPARFLRENMHGDRVGVRVETAEGFGKREGRIIRTLERGYTRIVGRFEAARNFGYVIPDEQRINHDIYIPPSAYGTARSGQVVVAELTTYPAYRRNPEGRIVEVLGWPDAPDVEVKTILQKYELPHVFGKEVMAEAQAVPREPMLKDLENRTNLREILTVTIDGETARDFDDAVAVRREGAENIRLWVSIADVAHYVKDGSALDREAYTRGTSVYFPDRCIPMLPEELSNGICSLNPFVDRLTMTAEMLFDTQGEMLEAGFYPSVIRSRARLTYTMVRDILESNLRELPENIAACVADLHLMRQLGARLLEKRRRRGSIDFDLPEPEIVLDLQGNTEAILKAERNVAHRIIEEFMLAANEAVATHLENRHVPAIYRIHENPDPVKLRDFQEFIYNYGYEFRLNEGMVNPGDLQKLLGKAEGRPEEKMLNEILLRCMKQARYAAENLGHFGLASPCYTHFTSPIRRYPDLVVHRVLKAALSGKLNKRNSDMLAARLPEVAEHSSKRERIAMEAEREIVTLKKLQFMQDKTGEEFEGFISGVTSFGFFVELLEFFVEGLVHVSTLRRDFYQYREKQHALVGEHSGEVFRIGDRVRVKVALVSLEKRQIDFMLIGSERQGKGVEKEPAGGNKFDTSGRGKTLKEKAKKSRKKDEVTGKKGRTKTQRERSGKKR